MVLCAGNEDHSKCVFVDPPASAKIGDRITWAGHEVVKEGSSFELGFGNVLLYGLIVFPL